MQRWQAFKRHSYDQQLKFFSLGLTIPIVIMTILVNWLLAVPVQDAYIAQHTDQIKSTVQNVNQQLSQVETLVSNWGYSFQNRFSIKPFSRDISVEDFNSVSKDLLVVENSSPLIDSCQLVYTGSDGFYFKPAGTWPLSAAEQKQYMIDNGQEFQWKKLSGSKLLLLHDVSNVLDPKHKVFVALTINGDAIVKLLANNHAGSTQGIRSQFAIDDQVILGQQALPKFGDHKNDSTWIQSLNGHKYSIVKTSFPRLTQHWTFYSAIPLDQVTAPIHNFERVMIIIGVISLLCSLVLSQLFARRQYAPLRKTMDKLFQDTGWKHDSNEFDYLVTKWEEMSSQQTSLQKIASQVTEHSRRTVIRQIINGYYQYLAEADLSKLVTDNGWKQWKGHYQVFLVQLHMPAATSEPHSVSSEFAPFAFKNVIHDVAQVAFSDYILIEEDMNCLLILTTDVTPEHSQQFMDEASHNLLRILGSYTTIVCSDSQTQLSLLGELRNKMMGRLRYRPLSASSVQLCLSTPLADVNYTYPVALDTAVLTAIKSGDEADVKASLTTFIENVTRQNNQQVILINAISRLYDHLDYVLKQQQLAASQFFAKNSLTQLLISLLKPEVINEFVYQNLLLPSFSAYHQTGAADSNRQLAAVVDYLNQHYTDADISLELLSDRFGLDIVALSKGFKRFTHSTFIDYLTTLRLTEAKRRLIETNDHISAIAESIGYNSSYFNRLFKRKFGVTPGQYRQAHVQGTPPELEE